MATVARPSEVATLAQSIPGAHFIGALSGVGLAVIAQHLLLDRRYPLDALLVYGLAVVLFVGSARALVAPNESPVVARGRVPIDLPLVRGAGWLLPGSAVAALITYQTFASNTFTRANLFFWTASLLMFTAAVLPGPGLAEWRIRRQLCRAVREGISVHIRLETIGLLVVIGLARIVPPLILALGGLWLLSQPRPRWQTALHLARGLAVSLGVALLLLVPLIHYMLDNPSMFWMRTASRLVGESSGAPFGIADVAASVVKALLMFNWRGDVGWTIVAPLLPVLDPVTGALFALGAAWLVYALVARRSLQAAVLLLSLVMLLAPTWASLAFPNEIPNANQSVTALPIVFLVAALTVGLLWRAARTGSPGPASVVVTGTMVAMLFLAAGQANFQRYFFTYAENYRRSAPNTAEIADAVRPFVIGIGTMRDVHTLLWPHWFDNRSLAFALGQPDWDQVVRDKGREIGAHAAQGGTRLYLVHPSDEEGRAILRASYPAAIERLHRSGVPGKDFVTFTVLDRG